MAIHVGAKGFLPTYAFDGSSGFDLRAADDIDLEPEGDPVLVPTDLYFGLEPGYEIQLRGRSGLAMKGVSLAHGVGTIDSDYRGEVLIPMQVTNGIGYSIRRGDKVAQGVLQSVPRVQFRVLDDPQDLGATTRQSRNFGSSGR